MDHHQTKKIRMIRASFGVAMDHSIVWAGHIAVEHTMRVVGDMLTETEDVIRMHSMMSEVATRQKNQVEMELMKDTLVKCALLWSVANTTGTEGLKALAEVSKTTLRDKRGEDLEGFCGEVLGALRTNGTALMALNFKPADAEAYQNMIAGYRDQLRQVRTLICERAAATARLKELNQQMTKVLRFQLDRLLLEYEESDPEFYMAYKNARKMVKMGVRRKKVEVAVLEVVKVEEVLSEPVVVVDLQEEVMEVPFSGVRYDGSDGRSELDWRKPFWRGVWLE